MNITDVGYLSSDADTGEDKMVKGAKRESSIKQPRKSHSITLMHSFADCKKLEYRAPDVVQLATGCIDEYIKIIEKLMDTGYAFAGGNVYFDTSRLTTTTYSTTTTRMTSRSVREGVEEDTNKRNKNDFLFSGLRNPNLRTRP